VHHCGSWRIRDQLDVTSYYVSFQFFYVQHVSDINTSIIRNLRLIYRITTPTHIETRTHDQCGNRIDKSQAPDDGCINVRNMLNIEEVKWNIIISDIKLASYSSAISSCCFPFLCIYFLALNEIAHIPALYRKYRWYRWLGWCSVDSFQLLKIVRYILIAVYRC